jgi:hypothetical protein
MKYMTKTYSLIFCPKVKFVVSSWWPFVTRPVDEHLRSKSQSNPHTLFLCFCWKNMCSPPPRVCRPVSQHLRWCLLADCTEEPHCLSCSKSSERALLDASGALKIDKKWIRGRKVMIIQSKGDLFTENFQSNSW